VTVRWLTVFIDRPSDTFDSAADFWQDVTGTARSATRGRHGQFATLLPVEGDAHIRVQRVDDGPGGTHLDIHTDDKSNVVDRAIGLRATVIDANPTHVLRSPGGYMWCVVDWQGEAAPGGPRSRLDQLCLDIARDRFEPEVRFWEALLGWPVQPSAVRPEFAPVARPNGMPLRMLFQRLARPVQ